MKLSIPIACVLTALPTGALATQRLVGTQPELLAALVASQPGDQVVLRNGIWNNLSVNFQNINGSPAAPVHIRAQTPGQVAIAGPNYFFDLGGNNYEVSGLIFKDENENQKSIRFRGAGANVHDNAILLGGRYNQILWDAQPGAAGPSQFHHNFLAGKQDRGASMVLDLSQAAHLHHNYFGHRPTGGPSSNNNGWETIRIGNSGIMASSLNATIERNYFEFTEGEAETISDKTHDNIIRDNTFKDIRRGWVTARHGGRGVYEGNVFINALGIRVGNSDDTTPDHPGLVIRNNYIEGPNAKILAPGYQNDLTIEGNSVIVTAGTYNGATYTNGKFGIEYTNTTNGTITSNLTWISDSTYAAMQAGTLGGIGPSAVGNGNVAFNAGSGPVFTTATPTAIRNLFATNNPLLVRDGYSIQRPTAAGLTSTGYTGQLIPLARNASVGPSWLDPVKRLNKFMPLELRFDGDFADGITSPTAHNTGYLSTPALLQSAAGTLTNLHSTDALGVSGRPGDRAFDNRATLAMGDSAGARAAVVDRQWFRELEAFTVQGWFKTDGAQSIGGGASLVEQIAGNHGWALRSTTGGVLSLSVGNGTTTTTVTSSGSFGAQNEWTFFAVTFDARLSSNEVNFYVASESQNVTLAGTKSLALANSSNTVSADLLIGAGFDGLLDNIRLFSARRNYTYIDDTGNSFTKTGNGQDYALLSLAELRTIRRYDLGIPLGDLNESRSVDAADIDLLRTSLGNGLYDIDGDLDADRADFDLLVYDILGTQPGDANLDGSVNIGDFSLLAANFNASAGWAGGNFNVDPVANIADFAMLASAYNTAPPGLPRAVPEPALAGAALLALSARRRQS